MAGKTAPKSKIKFREESLRLLFEKYPVPVWMFSEAKKILPLFHSFGLLLSDSSSTIKVGFGVF